ncbi:MAG: carbohydrate-binding domain-containing protein [Clostridiales bacterium]|nr:carbohydrate-binding domain-containing protein [Clostridiales bacterium]
MKTKIFKNLTAALFAAATISFGAAYTSLNITVLASDTYTYEDEDYSGEYDITTYGSIEISSAGTYHIYGNSIETSNTITVSGSADVTLVLDNVNISSSETSPISLTSSGTTTIVLYSTNILTCSSVSYAGLSKGTSGNLIIAAWGNDNSMGSLTATGGMGSKNHRCGAGIGGDYSVSSNNITINSGKITATGGGNNGAGIGGGQIGSGSNIINNKRRYCFRCKHTRSGYWRRILQQWQQHNN